MRSRALTLIVLVFGSLLLAGGPVGAQDQSIGGTLEVIDGPDRAPVAGVRVTVSLDGSEVGTAVSEEDGSWRVPVPTAGVYEVRLDVDSLPDGAELTDPTRDSLPGVDVRTGQQKVVRFALGPGIASDVGDLERFVDLVVLGLKLGAIIAMAAVGLSLVFSVTGLVNFAHGELVTLGAVVAFFFHVSEGGPGWRLIVGAVPAVLLVAAFGGLQERFLWRPLRLRRVGLIAMLVVSIGLSFAVRNLVLVVMGGEPDTYRDYVVQADRTFLGVSTVPKNVVIIVSAVVLLALVGFFLLRTQTGIAMRAVADNRDLAESSGIDVNRIILSTWVMGAGLAGLGGIFLGVSEQVQWNMGFRILLLIFAAVVLGGLGTAFGAMLGGFVIGLAVEISTFWIDTELKNAVALAVLVGMLLVRPQGLLGMRERIG